MNDIQIIENCISKQVQDEIEKIFTGAFFPWYLNDSALYGDEGNKQVLNSETQKSLLKLPNVVDAPQFTHTILSAEKQWSSAYPYILPLLTAIPYTVNELVRIKTNLNTPSRSYGDSDHGIPHIDILDRKNIKTCIYYVNDSDGDTILFKENLEQKKYKSLNEECRITPKKGTLVVFDGQRLHSGNKPKQFDTRIVININFVPFLGN